MKRSRQTLPDRPSGAELYVIEGGMSAKIDAYTAAELCGHPSVYRPGSSRVTEVAGGRKLVVVSEDLSGASA